MKKILLAVLLAVALLVTLVACSGGGDEETTTAAEQSTTAGETTTAAETTTATDVTTSQEVTVTEETTIAEETTVEVTTAEETTVEETTEEETTVDPAAPVLYMSPEDIATAVATGMPNRVSAEEGYKSVKIIPESEGCDPYFRFPAALDAGAYAILKYKSEVEADGQFFIGSTGDVSGLNGDVITFTYENTNGEWDYLLVDLTESAQYDGTFAAYWRFDPYCGAGNTLELAWIACFNDLGYATSYMLTDALCDEILDKTDADAQFKNYSFDGFYLDGASYFAEDGNADKKLDDQDGTVTFKYGETHTSMAMRGWAYFDQPIAAFGYYAKVELGDLTICKFIPGEFVQERPDVKAAISEDAEGYNIIIDFDAEDFMPGTYKIGSAAKLADGRIVGLYEITIVCEDAEDLPAGSGMSPDTYYEDGEMLVDGNAHNWIATNRPNGISGVETAGFRGWCGLGEASIAAYGYAIGGAAPVFSEDFIVAPEPGLAEAAVQPNVTRYLITVPFAGLDAGEYELKILVKDTDGNIYQMMMWGALKVVSYGSRPDEADYDAATAEKDLGIAPRNASPLTPDNTPFGYKFTLGMGEYLNSVTVTDMATYSDSETIGTFKLYYWMGDLASTRASEPICVIDIINHVDNQTLTVDVSKYNLTWGEYYYECEGKGPKGHWTCWGCDGGNAEGCVGYVGDAEAPFRSTINVSTYTEKDPFDNIVPISSLESEGVTRQSTDSYTENGVQPWVYTPSAAKWLGGNKSEADNRVNGIGDVDNATFYGWASLGDVKIAEFGYILNGELVTSESFDLGLPEADAQNLIAAGGENTKRYSVVVDFTGITEAGEYPIAIVAIGEDGVIYQIDKWNNCSPVDGFVVKFVKLVPVDVSTVEVVKARSFTDSVGGRWLRDDETPAGGAKAWFSGWIGTTENFDGYKIGMFVEGTGVIIEMDFAECMTSTEQGVIDAAAAQGATYATRYLIEEPFPMAAGLPAGDYNVIGFITTADGTMINIGEVIITKDA